MATQSPPFVDAAPDMVDAGVHLGAPQILQSMIAETGYLFLRGVINRDMIAWARGEMIAALAEEGLLHPEAVEKHARGEIDTEWTERRVSGVGIPGRQAQAAFKKRRIWESFVEMPGVRDVFEKIAGGPVNFLPISEYRSAAPGSRTPVHQDGSSNYGYGVHTAWFPAMPIDGTLGGVAVLPKTPDRPYPLLKETADAPPELVSAPGWLCADYHPGDMVVFEGSVLHCGLVNHSENRLRLSFEIRFQGPFAPRPVIGRIVSITTGSLTVETDEGERVTLAITDETQLRGDRFRSSSLIPRTELANSDLVPGFSVIVAQRDGAAISVRGIF